MSFSPSNILGLCLFAMGATWLVLARNLFRLLSTKYPQKYEELGKPSLTQNNNFRTNIRFLKFLFGSESDLLNDLPLSKRLRFMRIWLIVFLASSVVSLSVSIQ